MKKDNYIFISIAIFCVAILNGDKICFSKNTVVQNTLNIEYGTLDVALATPKFIVVATDSRRTFLDTGRHEDTSKKLFIVGKKRILAIAGLAGVSINGLPWLTAQIAPLLDDAISRYEMFGEYDNYYWNDPPPPHIEIPNELNELPEEVKKSLKEKMNIKHEEIWWDDIHAHMQTITNIAYACKKETDFNNYVLDGLLAGFKDNGEAKIVHLGMKPIKCISNWGRPYIGIGRIQEHFTTSKHLIWRTAGITQGTWWQYRRGTQKLFGKLSRDCCFSKKARK